MNYKTCELCRRFTAIGHQHYCKHPSGSLKKKALNDGCDLWEPKNEKVREQIKAFHGGL